MNAPTPHLPDAVKLQSLTVERWNNGYQPSTDWVAEEMPIGLEYNGVPHVVMMATPADLEDFAVGFSLSEGIVSHIDEIHDIEVEEYSSGIRVMLEIAEDRFSRLEGKRQNLAGRTGCGLCGTERLAQVFRPMRDVTSSQSLSITALNRALEQLPQHQTLQRATGATHGAFWLDASGSITLAREDVGRHNALDKLIGALARERENFGHGSVLITSRASYEMVQKSIQMGVGILVAISAPTALAVRMAEQYNLTLAGFARNGQHVAYAHPERLIP
jgi:FdhD protein